MRRCLICKRPMKMEYVEYPRRHPDGKLVLYRNVRRYECPEGCRGVRLDFSSARPASTGVHPIVLPRITPLKKPADFNDKLLGIGLGAAYLLLVLATFAIPMALPLQAAAILALTGGVLATYRAATTRVVLPSYFPVPRPVVERPDEPAAKQPGEKTETAAAAAPTQEKAAPTEVKGGSIPMVVTVAGEKYEIMLEPGENMLTGALDREVSLDYSCLEGMCDSCMVKVIAGAENLTPPTPQEIDMLGDDVHKGFRLACQVKVNGPVTIEQD